MFKEHWIKLIRVSIPKLVRLLATLSSFGVALL